MSNNANFTLEDLHRLRYANYEKTKNLSAEELIEKTKKAAKNGWERIFGNRSRIKDNEL